jgi:hypothetical protein
MKGVDMVKISGDPLSPSDSASTANVASASSSAAPSNGRSNGVPLLELRGVVKR